jgi:hypothetical protein
MKQAKVLTDTELTGRTYMRKAKRPKRDSKSLKEQRKASPSSPDRCSKGSSKSGHCSHAYAASPDAWIGEIDHSVQRAWRAAGSTLPPGVMKHSDANAPDPRNLRGRFMKARHCGNITESRCLKYLEDVVRFLEPFPGSSLVLASLFSTLGFS